MKRYEILEQRKKVLEMAKQFFKYDPENGVIYGKRGRMKNGRSKQIDFRIGDKRYRIFKSHFCYYCLTDKVAETVVHLNGDANDFRFWNLKEESFEEKLQNKKSRGYVKIKNGKYGAVVWYTKNNKRNFSWLGTFNTKEEARRRYLQEKKRIHLEFSIDKFSFKENL